ncbi:4-hydroxy-3-methylbut-2-enyl diphosphate reductase [bacterium]|nr:4-hydroxy-3-methylbut-2-enyl diphosphate reductase [bacterium]
MEVIVTKNAGFCFGVRRSLDLLDLSISSAKKDKKQAVMLGSIIHNPRVIQEYGEQGVSVVSIDALPDDGVVVVRSHGITRDDEIRLVAQKGVNEVDTTCPFVKRIYELVTPFTRKDEAVIVLGSSNHAEVKAIVSRIVVDCLVIAPEELESAGQKITDFIQQRRRVLLVAQTTSQPSNYLKVLGVLTDSAAGKQIEIVQENTVCNATNYRQDSAREVARQVDAMVVIGGFNSSNTHKLFLVVSEILDDVWHIESPSDFTQNDISVLKKSKKVGITAGASTPDNQIEELKVFLEQL